MALQILAVIPARGGSKGLPRKNLRLLAGRPMLSFTIRAAQKSRLDRVILSTDSEEIAEIGRQCGADVPFIRPAELARDQSSSLSVVMHALEWMADHENYHPDAVALLQPTSPLRTSEHIDKAIELLEKSGAKSVIGVSAVEEAHPFFMFHKGEDERLNYIMEANPRPMRRQDLPPIYRINGALYITRREYFNDLPDGSPVFDGSNLVGLEMGHVSSLDINTYIDFQHAETMLLERENNK
jgi:CMP-N,N'-diacetyllegionaminic acid synthase